MDFDLQSENRELKRQIAELAERARHDDQVLSRFRKVELRLIGIVSFKELVEAILEDYREAFELDAVTLALVDTGCDLRRSLMDADTSPEGYAGLLLFDDEALLTGLFGKDLRPVLSAFDRAKHGELFPPGQPEPASIALLPLLRWGQVVGALGLGSVRPDRFVPGMATQFIEWLAAVASVCLENVANNERLKHIGLTDALTGVHNRRYFDQRLREEVDRALRKGQPLSCLLIDCDHFKRVNDEHGHLVGDVVLREVAEQVKDQLRLSDAMARYGGEEFVILLVQTGAQTALTVAERIRESLASHPVEVGNDTNIRVTLSIGVATLEDEVRGADVDAYARQLVAQADRALYAAKNGGRNRVLMSTAD